MSESSRPPRASSDEFVAARNGTPVKIFMTLLVGALAAFMLAMAVLVSHDSRLTCESNLQCVHVETYPFGIVRREEPVKVTAASTAWDPGGSQMAIKLVLKHDDDSTTEYQGVGKNGERAQRVAASINAFIEQPTTTRDFALREGSLAAASFMALLALLASSTVPYFFSKIRLRARHGNLAMTIERWPLPPRHVQCALERVIGFNLRRKVVTDQEFIIVTIEIVDDDAGIDTGMAFRTVDAANKRLASLNDWLAQQRGGSDARL